MDKIKQKLNTQVMGHLCWKCWKTKHRLLNKIGNAFSHIELTMGGDFCSNILEGYIWTLSVDYLWQHYNHNYNWKFSIPEPNS